MKKLRVTASKGIIAVNSAIVMQRSRTVLWISIDTVQKYPDLLTLFDYGVHLAASKETLNVKDRRLPPTEIEVHGLTGKWRMFTDVGRYSVNMVFVRERDDREDLEDLLDDACRSEQ